MRELGELDHPVFDADNHYYEALDAFTRHLDPKLGPRVIEWCEIGGRRYQVIGGRVNRAVTNPTFDPIALPGPCTTSSGGIPTTGTRWSSSPVGSPSGPPTASPRRASPHWTSRDCRDACCSPPSG